MWDGPEEALTKEKSGRDSDGVKEVGSNLCRYMLPMVPLCSSPPLLSCQSTIAFYQLKCTDLIAACRLLQMAAQAWEGAPTEGRCPVLSLHQQADTP